MNQKGNNHYPSHKNQKHNKNNEPREDGRKTGCQLVPYDRKYPDAYLVTEQEKKERRCDTKG
jgi:hypothetical protein